MGPLLVFFLYILLHLQATIRSEIIATPNLNLNSLNSAEDENFNDKQSSDELQSHTAHSTPTQALELPLVKTAHDQAEVELRYPIVSVNVDYARNLIVLKFRKSGKLDVDVDDEEVRRHKSMAENFMRLGRANTDFMRLGRAPTSDFMRFGRGSGDFMRFGKRAVEHVPKMNSLDFQQKYDKDADANRRFERSQEAIRDSRGDNFMRFGRRHADGDFMRFGRGSADFMRFGRGGSNDFMRFGRGPKTEDFMRFGRMPQQTGGGRDTDRDFMRFGSLDNFMRLGRSSAAVRANGKADQNLMRLGKSTMGGEHNEKENITQPPLPKEVIKEAAKILHHAEQFGGEGETNPMDRAFKVLFGKQGGLRVNSAEKAKAAQNNNVNTSDEDDEAERDDYELTGAK